MITDEREERRRAAERRWWKREIEFMRELHEAGPAGRARLSAYVVATGRCRRFSHIGDWICRPGMPSVAGELWWPKFQRAQLIATGILKEATT